MRCICIEHICPITNKSHTVSAFCVSQEIEKLWKMVDAAHEKEARARDTINQLKLEIANLTKLVEQGAGLSFGQENL